MHNTTIQTLYNTMSGEAEAKDPNDSFDERKLYVLIDNEEFDEVIEFLNNKSFTAKYKTAAVNCKYDRANWTTLMNASYIRAPLVLVKQLCEIGGKDLIMAKSNYGSTALHFACGKGGDPNLDTVKLLVEKGRKELLIIQNNNGETALDLVNDREGDVYKYLLNAGDYLCSSIVGLVICE